MPRATRMSSKENYKKKKISVLLNQAYDVDLVTLRVIFVVLAKEMQKCVPNEQQRYANGSVIFYGATFASDIISC